MGPVQVKISCNSFGYESATVAANGYRFRIPYGTLLCVSISLCSELKLRKAGVLKLKFHSIYIGVRTMEDIKDALGRLQTVN